MACRFFDTLQRWLQHAESVNFAMNTKTFTRVAQTANFVVFRLENLSDFEAAQSIGKWLRGLFVAQRGALCDGTAILQALRTFCTPSCAPVCWMTALQCVVLFCDIPAAQQISITSLKHFDILSVFEMANTALANSDVPSSIQTLLRFFVKARAIRHASVLLSREEVERRLAVGDAAQQEIAFKWLTARTQGSSDLRLVRMGSLEPIVAACAYPSDNLASKRVAVALFDLLGKGAQERLATVVTACRRHVSE